jgi:carbon storage regulator CsrA
MLVLTRKLDEAVLIGDAIRIQVVSLEPGRVRLGIRRRGHSTRIHER